MPSTGGAPRPTAGGHELGRRPLARKGDGPRPPRSSKGGRETGRIPVLDQPPQRLGPRQAGHLDADVGLRGRRTVDQASGVVSGCSTREGVTPNAALTPPGPEAQMAVARTRQISATPAENRQRRDEGARRAGEPWRRRWRGLTTTPTTPPPTEERLCRASASTSTTHSPKLTAANLARRVPAGRLRRGQARTAGVGRNAKHTGPTPQGSSRPSNPRLPPGRTGNTGT